MSYSQETPGQLIPIENIIIYIEYYTHTMVTRSIYRQLPKTPITNK